MTGIKIFLITLSIFLAILNLVDAILSHKQKKLVLSKLNSIVKFLEHIKPMAVITNVKRKWLFILIEYISYVVFLYLILYLIENTQLRLKDVILKEIYEVYERVFDTKLNNDFLYQITPYIPLVAGILLLFRPEQGDDFYTSIEEVLIKGSITNALEIFVLRGLSLAFLIFFWYKILDWNNSNRLDWLPNWILAILVFCSITILLFMPLFITNFFAVFSFSFAILVTISIIELIIVSLKKTFTWVINNPKKSWAAFLALIGLVIAIGGFYQ
jgi:hypothetical protein